MHLDLGLKTIKHFDHDLVPRYNLRNWKVGADRFYAAPFPGSINNYDPDTIHVYPSVTTVIAQKTDQTALIKWRKKLGEDQANSVSLQAQNRGNSYHAMFEKVMGNDPLYWAKQGTVNVSAFNKVVPTLESHITSIYGIELQLFSHKLKAAGTADLICKWDGVPSIVDLKTSRKVREEKYLVKYYIQATAYAIMFKEVYGIDIPQIVVIMLTDHEDGPEIYVKDPSYYYGTIEEYFECSF